MPTVVFSGIVTVENAAPVVEEAVFVRSNFFVEPFMK
jgi:hypothetical protein